MPRKLRAAVIKAVDFHRHTNFAPACYAVIMTAPAPASWAPGLLAALYPNTPVEYESTSTHSDN
jgi:hypothetical protein